MSPATIQDVARLTNVSVATVSRVQNNSTAVKPKNNIYLRWEWKPLKCCYHL